MKFLISIVGASALMAPYACFGETVVKHSASNLCFNTANGDANPINGTEVVLKNNCTGPASSFSWTSGGSIKHEPSGKCVHPGGAVNPENGQRLVLWDGCDFADRVRFRATGADSVQHVSSNKCLHPEGGSATPAQDTRVVVWGGCNESRLAFTVQEQVATPARSGAVSVNINVDMKHAVDQFDSFDRRKYITVHASHTEDEWFGNNPQSLFAPNANPDYMTQFLEDYDVYMGRDTGAMAYHLSRTDEDPSRPGYASPASMDELGGGARFVYTSDQSTKGQAIRRHAHRNTDLTIGAQQHPYWPDGKTIGDKNWSFSQQNTPQEALGTATGDFLSNYLFKFYNLGDGDEFGQQKPKYIEVMNEPLFELYDAPINSQETPIATLHEVFEFHNTVAEQVRANPENDDVLIGGYTVAFPDYEKGDTPFDQWRERDQYFLDLAGDNMDFISIHLYDFPNFPEGDQVKEQYRKGSNMEATLDMLEQYMAFKWGSDMRPLMVSEYGSQLQGSFGTPWTPERDWLCLKAINSMMMSFLERPNRIEKAIPFIPLKAEWGRISDEIPYYWRLMRQAKEGEGQTGNQWVYTEQVKFYQLWSEVKGKRVDSWASDLDIQVDAYVDGNDTYVILNSLEFSPTEIDLSFLGAGDNGIRNVQVKHLFPDASGKPQLAVFDQSFLPESVTVGSEATMILKVSYNQAVNISGISQETKHYAASTLRNITANQSQRYNINSVDVGANGEAVLRIGVGRDHGKSLSPRVLVNGTQVAIPSDYRGYEQQHGGLGRDRFFGVLEIPVPYNLLRVNNNIDITFNDNGGAVSSVTLQHFKQSRAITRR